MKWQLGTAYLRRLIGAPAEHAPYARHVDYSLPISLLADSGLCFAAVGEGASLRTAQTAGFAAAVCLSYWLDVRRRMVEVAPTARWKMLASVFVATLLIFVLRGGLLELLVQWQALPTYLALILAVLVTGFVMKAAYGLCRSDVQWSALAIGVVGYAFLLRLIYSAQIELMPEEAYYWNYSQHLDIGYLDHPPLVAWLIRGGTGLFGDTQFGVRFGALCCGLVTAFFLFRLTRNLFGERAALLALAAAQVLPYFFMSGMLMTPDAPLTAAWAASLYFLERALIGGRSRAWICAGVALGIGLLSKYTIGLLGLAVFSFMLVDAPSRGWFRRWEPYAAVLLAAAVFSPAIVWNAQHGWASFAFQTSRRLAEHPAFSLHKLIGAAIVLMTPTGLLTMAVVFIQSRRGSAASAGTEAATRRWRFLQAALLIPLAVFVLFSLRHEVKLDWTGAPWEAALPAMAFGISERPGWRNSSLLWRLRRAWVPTVICMLMIYGAGFYYLTLGIPGVGYTAHTELIPIGWRGLGHQINAVADAVRLKYGEKSLVVGMDRYAIASELAFYSDDRVKSVAGTSTAHLFGEMGLMYEQWFPPVLQSGRTLLLVAWDPAELVPARLGKYVDALGPLQEGVLTRDGHTVRRYYFRVAHGYHASNRSPAV